MAGSPASPRLRSVIGNVEVVAVLIDPKLRPAGLADRVSGCGPSTTISMPLMSGFSTSWMNSMSIVPSEVVCRVRTVPTWWPASAERSRPLMTVVPSSFDVEDPLSGLGGAGVAVHHVEADLDRRAGVDGELPQHLRGGRRVPPLGGEHRFRCRVRDGRLDGAHREAVGAPATGREVGRGRAAGVGGPGRAVVDRGELGPTGVDAVEDLTRGRVRVGVGSRAVVGQDLDGEDGRVLGGPRRKSMSIVPSLVVVNSSTRADVVTVGGDDVEVGRAPLALELDAEDALAGLARHRPTGSRSAGGRSLRSRIGDGNSHCIAPAFAGSS
jgi:hypothetical protein